MTPPHSRELARLRTENEILREQLAAFGRTFLGDALVFPPEWRLTPTEQRFVAVLLMRPVATRDMLLTAMYRDAARDEPRPEIMNVLVFKIRPKLRPRGIEIHTVWGQGFRLDEAQRVLWRGRLSWRAAA